MGRPLRILVVDDSALVRQTMIALLAAHGERDVEVAGDPLIAMEKMRRARPDVIVLDLVMPRMDGLTFLEQIMTTAPIPVVVCSALGASAERAAMRALELGAVEVIAKPALGIRDFLNESAAAIVDAIRGAAEARLVAPASREGPLPPHPPLAPRASPRGARVVAIGASAGGPEALLQVLRALPADAPPLLIVQHMPQGFTASLARRFDELCAISVKEARSGDLVAPGQALVAPGNRHMILRGASGRLTVEIVDGPSISRHRPSVDALFRSTAEVAGRRAVGVILTGMGDDGAAGLRAMKDAGAATIAQDEETSVVFGMPRAAVRAGAVDEVLPIHRIADALVACSRAAAPGE